MTNVAPLPGRRAGNDANLIVAANVRSELGLAGLNQADLAAALGEGAMWLSRRMNGLTGFSVTDAQRIADFFGIEVAELFVDRRKILKRAAVAKNGPGVESEADPLPHLDSNQEPIVYRSVWYDQIDWIAPVTSIDAAPRFRELVTA